MTNSTSLLEAGIILIIICVPFSVLGRGTELAIFSRYSLIGIVIGIIMVAIGIIGYYLTPYKRDE